MDIINQQTIPINIKPVVLTGQIFGDLLMLNFIQWVSPVGNQIYDLKVVSACLYDLKVVKLQLYRFWNVQIAHIVEGVDFISIS